MRAWIVIPLFLAAVGTTVLATSWRRGRQGDRLPGSTADGHHTRDDELRSLERDVERLKREPKTRVYLSASPAPAEAPAPAGPEDRERAAERAREKFQAAVAAIEQHYVSEPVDQEWSPVAVRQIREAITGQDARSRINAVECASSLCRVALEHDSRAAQREIATAVGGQAPFGAGVMYVYGEGSGPPTTTLYVMREGHNLGEILGGL